MRFQNSKHNRFFVLPIVMLPLLLMALYPPTATNTVLQSATLTPTPISFTKLTGHSKTVRKIAFSPDGQMLVSAGDDKTVRLWDLKPDKEIRQFTGHSDYVNDVTFSKDGKFIITASDDKTARTWDVETGKELRHFQHTDAVKTGYFSSDGKLVVTGSSDKTVRIWNVSSGAELLRYVNNQPIGARFSPDGRLVVAPAFNDLVHILDATTLKEIKQFSTNTSTSLDADFSFDSKRLAVAGGSYITLWDIEKGVEIRKIAVGDSVKNAVFSPDSKMIASIVNQRIHVWNADNGQLLGLSDNAILIETLTLAFSPDGTQLAVSISSDNSISLWHVASLLNVTTTLNGVWVSHIELSKVTPPSWRADSADKARYVVETGPEQVENIEVCDYAPGAFSLATSSVRRGRYFVEVTIKDVLTGATISRKKVYGGLPDPCKSREILAPGESKMIYGTKPDVSTASAWLIDELKITGNLPTLTPTPSS